MSETKPTTAELLERMETFASDLRQSVAFAALNKRTTPEFREAIAQHLADIEEIRERFAAADNGQIQQARQWGSTDRQLGVARSCNPYGRFRDYDHLAKAWDEGWLAQGE